MQSATDHMPVPALYREPERAALIALVGESFRKLTGRPLTAPSRDPVAALWAAPRAILAHGTQADPLFFFGNACALKTFGYSAEQFVGTPSRLSAQAPERGERQALLERVTRDGFIDDYAGIRVTATGERFRIEGATVWNLIDASGVRLGQAATFLP